ncbi:ScbA/BarX family gamma-butyrolactone biosynthesis protein [Sphaerisporangium dianthi]|uniref:ScbA/BarX family gamma-butyrolactone biosynthesis protein n=1 Tax=Sphaerisporangium dianthi TaxID=1436120 RepID=A0ABV9CBP4_9ACTN
MATPDLMDMTVDPALFEQTVPRRLVHRSAVSEVMITGWRPLDEKTSIVAAQWPRAHGFYGPAGGCHDPLLAAETIRQAGLVVSHAELDCPLDRIFLLWDLSYEVNLAELAVGPGPTNLVLRFTRSQVRHRGRHLAGLRGHIDFYRDGRLVGMGEGSFDCVSRAAHDRLRAPSMAGRPAQEPPLPEPVDPRLVGRDRPLDVVLGKNPDRSRVLLSLTNGGDRPLAHLSAIRGDDGPADPLDRAGGREGVWPLRVDPAHPVLFDHSLDHVPGMALMEAMRQAALALAHPLPVAPVKIYASFTRYVDLWGGAVVRAKVDAGAGGGELPVRVSIEQAGEVAAAGLVLAGPLPAT